MLRPGATVRLFVAVIKPFGITMKNESKKEKKHVFGNDREIIWIGPQASKCGNRCAVGSNIWGV
jgi:hypothetical protein